MIVVNSINDLPPPNRVEKRRTNVTIGSTECFKVKDNSHKVIHKIRLPVDSQYIFNLKICCHPLITDRLEYSYKIYTVDQSLEAAAIKVTYECNLDSRVIIEKFYEKPSELVTQEIFPVYFKQLEIIEPLITESLKYSIPEVFLRFNSAPKTNYWIEYDCGWVDDEVIKQRMRNRIIQQNLPNGVIRYHAGSAS